MKRGVLILLLVLSLGFIAADSIPLYVAPLNSTGHLQPNTAFRYDINFSTGDCVNGPFVVNHTQAISTNAGGIGFINVTFSNPSATPTLICQFQNGTLRSVLPLSSQFFNGIFAQSINASGNTTSNWFHGKINASFIQNAPWSSSSGGNSSWNQSYANTLYHAITSQLGNTTSQVFAAIDNGTFLRVSQWNATNTSYLLIDRFNTTNTSYRTLLNTTFSSDVVANNLCYTNGTNCPAAGVGDITAIYTLNSFISLNNTDSNDIYLNFNSTHLNLTTDLRYFTKAQWNVTNTSYLLIDQWNSTNTTYRTLSNLTFANSITILGNLTGAGFVNATNIFPGSINATHIPLGTINATHITRFVINSTHINYGEINQTRLALFLINNSHITASSVNGSQILAFSINASRIAQTSVNSTHLAFASVNASALDINTVNTTHITANTIDPSDLSAAVNATFKATNLTYTANLNITTQNITIQNGTTAGRYCLDQNCASYIYNNGTHSIWK